MALSDTALRKAKCGERPTKLADGGGLYVLLKPSGAKWWRWDYKRPVTGKRNTLSLGTYPDTPTTTTTTPGMPGVVVSGIPRSAHSSPANL